LELYALKAETFTVSRDHGHVYFSKTFFQGSCRDLPWEHARQDQHPGPWVQPGFSDNLVLFSLSV